MQNEQKNRKAFYDLNGIMGPGSSKHWVRETRGEALTGTVGRWGSPRRLRAPSESYSRNTASSPRQGRAKMPSREPTKPQRKRQRSRRGHTGGTSHPQGGVLCGAKHLVSSTNTWLKKERELLMFKRAVMGATCGPSLAPNSNKATKDISFKSGKLENRLENGLH